MTNSDCWATGPGHGVRAPAKRPPNNPPELAHSTLMRARRNSREPRNALSIPHASGFGRGSRSQPAALVSDRDDAAYCNHPAKAVMGDRQAAASLPVPWQQLIEPRGGMIGDATQHIGEPGLGVDAVEFGGGDQGETAAARSPPRSEPANRQARRPRAIPRSARSAALYDTQTRPSSRKRVKAGQRLRIRRPRCPMASGVRCKPSPDQAPFAARDGVPGDQRGRLSRWDAAPKALMGDTDAALPV